jgi:plastocyanin
MRSWIRFAPALCIGAATAATAGEIAGKVDATPPKYLEETVVYVEKAPGTFAPKTHKIDQKGMKFIPHIVIVTAGDTVEFLNSDSVDHNVYSPDNDGYNLGMIASKKDGKHTFDKPGVYSQLCSVHPEMLAYVIVGQNPFAAVVGKDGKYKIEGVPAGEYKVLVWNSHLKAPSASVTVGAGKSEANFSVKR